MYVRTCTGLTEQVDDLTTWTESLATLLIKVYAHIARHQNTTRKYHFVNTVNRRTDIIV